MKVIIPVAGIGTRLRPHTHTAPKALLHVAGKPLLAHILDSLAEIKFDEITFVVGFLGERIIKYVRSSYDFNAKFVPQEKLLGLGYAIDLAIADNETDDLLIILGDTIVETKWNEIIGAKTKTLSGFRQLKIPERFGVAEVDGDKIIRLLEKPKDPPSNLALVGVYYIKDTREFKKSLKDIVVSNIKTKNEYQVTDAFQLMLENGCEMHTYSIEGWYDCGKLETLLETNRHLLNKCEQCQPEIEGSVIIRRFL